MNELRLDVRGNVGWLTIDRPARRNAMSLAMWRGLPGLIKRIQDDESVRVLVLQGAQARVFSAGADIEEIEQHATDEAAAARFMDAVEGGTEALARCPKPTIAMIRGDCIGGGVELAMACDIRFASRFSGFSVPPSKIGVLYGFGSTKRLVELVGPGCAKDLLFSGRMFDATEALAVGLVERVYALEDIVAMTSAYADLLTQRSRASIAGGKQMVSGVLSGLTVDDPELRRVRMENFLGSDLKEGVRAFLEKRAPSFS